MEVTKVSKGRPFEGCRVPKDYSRYTDWGKHWGVNRGPFLPGFQGNLGVDKTVAMIGQLLATRGTNLPLEKITNFPGWGYPGSWCPGESYWQFHLGQVFRKWEITHTLYRHGFTRIFATWCPYLGWAQGAMCQTGLVGREGDWLYTGAGGFDPKRAQVCNRDTCAGPGRNMRSPSGKGGPQTKTQGGPTGWVRA